MVHWRHRHLGYKIGFCGVTLSVFVYILGFSLPYWSMLRLRRYGYVDRTIGLWQSCIHQSMTCASNVHDSNPAWINASRAMASLALILFSVAVVSGCYRNFTRNGQSNSRSPGRHIETLSAFGTIVGFVGCIIFATEFNRVYSRQNNLGHLYWGFGVVCSALCLTGINSCLMFIFNRDKYLRRRRSTATLRMRGPNGLPVSIQFPTGLGEERFHIPYFGEISPDQCVFGATPMQPPSYETATQGVNYSTPPDDAADAPPLYEDITKDPGQLPTPAPVVQQLRNENKDGTENDTHAES